MEGLSLDSENRGIIPRMMGFIFEKIRELEGIQFRVKCSFIEIYNEKI
jgi:hypothetical protein